MWTTVVSLILAKRLIMITFQQKKLGFAYGRNFLNGHKVNVGIMYNVTFFFANDHFVEITDSDTWSEIFRLCSLGGPVYFISFWVRQLCLWADFGKMCLALLAASCASSFSATKNASVVFFYRRELALYPKQVKRNKDENQFVSTVLNKFS